MIELTLVNGTRLFGCQSANHTHCNLEDGLWECERCGGCFCLEDGGADDELCDNCWVQDEAAQRRVEQTHQAILANMQRLGLRDENGLLTDEGREFAERLSHPPA